MPAGNVEVTVVDFPVIVLGKNMDKYFLQHVYIVSVSIFVFVCD